MNSTASIEFRDLFHEYGYREERRGDKAACARLLLLKRSSITNIFKGGQEPSPATLELFRMKVAEKNAPTRNIAALQESSAPYSSKRTWDADRELEEEFKRHVETVRALFRRGAQSNSSGESQARKVEAHHAATIRESRSRPGTKAASHRGSASSTSPVVPQGTDPESSSSNNRAK